VEYSWDGVKAVRQDADSKTEEEKTLDLSGIKIRVTTDKDTGQQTVTFTIPQELMPTYYPDLYKQFYYQEEPIRLIYKVAMTDDATASAQRGQTFYTDAWDEDWYGDDENFYYHEYGSTTVTFEPDESNLYYYAEDEDELDARNEALADNTTRYKEDDGNATQTAETAFLEEMALNGSDDDGSAESEGEDEDENTSSSATVTQYLGNNGSLTAQSVETLTIKKLWDSSVSSTNQKETTVYVFREKEYADGTTGTIGSYGTYTLNSKNSWTATLNAAEKDGEDAKGEYTWKYYVTESLVSSIATNNYRPYYTDNAGNMLSYVTRSVTMKNDGGEVTNARLYPLTDAGLRITNQSNSLTVSKVWEDNDVGANAVTVYLYEVCTPINGSASTTTLKETLTLSASNGWTYTKSVNPSFGIYWVSSTTAGYCYYDYFITEAPLDGYGATYAYTGTTDDLAYTQLTVGGNTVDAYPAQRNVTITNSKTVPKITVTKEWADDDEVDHSKDFVAVELMAQVTYYLQNDPTTPHTGYITYDDLRTTLDAQNNWTDTFTLEDVGKTYYVDGLPAVIYTVESYFISETGVYLDADNGTPTDKYTPVYYGVDSSGNKTLVDVRATTEPMFYVSGAVEVEDTDMDMESIFAAQSDSEYGQYQDATAEEEEEFEEEAEEELAGALRTISAAATPTIYPAKENMVICNVPNDDTLTITKSWSGYDDYASQIPASITVDVYRVPSGDAAMDVTDITPYETVTLSASNGWTATIEAPKTVDGKAYQYYVKEADTGDYNVTYTGGDGKTIGLAQVGGKGALSSTYAYPVDQAVTITNTRQETLTLTKVWSDGVPSGVTSIDVNVYCAIVKDDVEQGLQNYKTVTLTAEDNWTATIPAPQTVQKEMGDELQTSHRNYYVEEVAVDGYAATYTVDGQTVEGQTKTVTINTVSSSGLPSSTTKDTVVYPMGTSQSVTITNAITYSLPDSGGPGTLWYTLGGVILLGSACTLYTFGTRRKPRRGIGGEC
jgi:hypothetical protein